MMEREVYSGFCFLQLISSWEEKEIAAAAGDVMGLVRRENRGEVLDVALDFSDRVRGMGSMKPLGR